MGTDKSNNAARPASYTVRQAAWILGVKPSTVSRAIRLGTLRAAWRHGKPLIPASALARLLPQPTGNDPRTGEEMAPALGGAEVTRDSGTPDYPAVAARLDRLKDVPAEVLTTSIVLGGLCLLELWPPVEPDWERCASSDRALAERLCEGCPVIDQCLELELRTAGASTTGVWGALAEDDRRALHRMWQRRRRHHGQEHGDQDGGGTR
ncbi:MAG TPA: WhiB family transcriptional regulator [Pseudonocardiaceae bacterium]|nr:WhiB family transcriptional regulator [Pseudonocardiaceae bacterium]